MNKLLARLPRFSDSGQRRAAGNIVKFLALLLALTLIARGTSGATLPRVELSSPTRGEIIEAVTGSATVSARDTLDLTVPEGLTILEMLVGAGQTVKNGDAVASFDADEVEEKLARETANLDKLLLDLEKLERTESADAYSLESARRSLARAREDYAATLAQGEADIAAARKTLDEALAEVAENPDAYSLESARRSLKRAREDYDATRKQGEADIAAAQKVLDEAVASAVEYADSTSLDNAWRSLQRAQEDYNATQAQGSADVAAAQSALDVAKSIEDDLNEKWQQTQSDTDKLAYETAQAETAKAQSALSAAQTKANENLQSASRRVEDAQASYTKALNDYDKGSQQSYDSRQAEIERAETALESAKSKASDNLQSAARRVEDAEASLVKAEQDYTKSTQQSSDSVLTEVERAETALESVKSKANDNLLSAARRVEDAETSLNKAKQDFEKSSRQTSDTTAQNSISAVSLRLDISEQKVVVDTLRLLTASGCVLYTDLEGVVSSAKPEGGVTDNNPLVSFMDGAKGFEAQFQISKTEADKLSVGDNCEVTTGGGGMYYNPTVTGTVSAISAPDDSDRVQITVRLPDGGWTRGQRVDIQAVQSRDTYDLCVPISALHSDNTGYYLLTVTQKSTVLGIENVVTAVPVTVSASDDEMAAVQGPVDRNGKVVTGSNKAVAAGDRVRVSE